MATAPFITQAVAQSLLTAFEAAADAGTAAIIVGYDDDAADPADADASAAGSQVIFELVCNATIFTSKTDGNPGAVGTFAAIGDDTALITDTLSFFRILTQLAGTVVFQGNADTAAADMIINTTAITVGSTISDTGTSTITVPEG